MTLNIDGVLYVKVRKPKLEPASGLSVSIDNVIASCEETVWLAGLQSRQMFFSTSIWVVSLVARAAKAGHEVSATAAADSQLINLSHSCSSFTTTSFELADSRVLCGTSA